MLSLSNIYCGQFRNGRLMGIEDHRGIDYRKKKHFLVIFVGLIGDNLS